MLGDNKVILILIFLIDIFKSIFLNNNVCISPTISLKFFLKVRIHNIPALVGSDNVLAPTR